MFLLHFSLNLVLRGPAVYLSLEASLKQVLFFQEYLDDLHHELIPKTYKGGRKPQWLVKELLEADKRQEERNSKNQKGTVNKFD